MLQLREAEHQQDERHVFAEVAVDADAPLELGIAAAAERDASLSAPPGDPHRQEEIDQREDAGIERDDKRDVHGAAFQRQGFGGRNSSVKSWSFGGIVSAWPISMSDFFTTSTASRSKWPSVENIGVSLR